jgi:hypothetical protein
MEARTRNNENILELAAVPTETVPTHDSHLELDVRATFVWGGPVPGGADQEATAAVSAVCHRLPHSVLIDKHVPVSG